MTNTISRNALKQALDSGEPITLVEALPEQYFTAGHLPGAININHDQIAALAPQRLPDQHARIVVYCSNAACNNSSLAAQRLISLGYTQVYKYAEGKQDWIDAGLPMEI